MRQNAIDEKLFHDIAVKVESEWGMGGLSDGMYADYAHEILIRYLTTHNAGGGVCESLD